MSFLKCVTVLCIFAVSIEGFSIKSPKILLPPEGLTLNVIISRKNKSDSLKASQIKENSIEIEDVPELGERSGVIVAGNCPELYVRIGTRCIPDYDTEE